MVLATAFENYVEIEALPGIPFLGAPSDGREVLRDIFVREEGQSEDEEEDEVEEPDEDEEEDNEEEPRPSSSDER